MRILQNSKIICRKSKIPEKSQDFYKSDILTPKIVSFLVSIAFYKEILTYSSKYSVFNINLIHFNSMDMGEYYTNLVLFEN